MSPLLPGATLGLIGGGQLARMMCLEARRMGYRTCVLDTEPDAPAVSLSDAWIRGRIDDLDTAQRLARVVDAITVDTEHVPASILSSLELIVPVRPSSSVLQTIQDRDVQRRFMHGIGAPQPRCQAVSALAELCEAAMMLGFPCVLKTRRAGYDGKGQVLIHGSSQLEAAWTAIGQMPAILEEFVAFDREISVLLARNPRGEMRFYPVAHNVHRNHVLRATVAPAPISPALEREAFDIAGRIANALDHVGMMAVEMFVVRGTTLLVNEIAPRPHNSGHYTFGACVTSQFEQHVRAVLDLPLGDTSLPRPAAMVNLLGDLWHDGEPDWTPVLSRPEARLHLYGKSEPRPGRKMGHVLIVDENPSSALRAGEDLLRRLETRQPGSLSRCA